MDFPDFTLDTSLLEKATEPEADMAKKYGVDKIPAIVLFGDRDYGIRFYGIRKYDIKGYWKVKRV